LRGVVVCDWGFLLGAGSSVQGDEKHFRQSHTKRLNSLNLVRFICNKPLSKTIKINVSAQ
ncbi:MAG TPA: hypothetical protein DCE56_22450, partial [Cyanobacteria bacterium UBA8553]|nr:hypothetical protein [Cyanobacteria bacterium UBA8553]